MRDPREMRDPRGMRDNRNIEVPDKRPQNVVDDLMYILKDINSTERDRFYRVLNSEYSGIKILSPYLQTIDESVESVLKLLNKKLNIKNE